MPEIVPSQVRPNGLTALGEILQGARIVSAAVAFVTESGVERLGHVFKEAGLPEAEIVARAGGVTSPDALVALRDELGVNVSVMIGRDASADPSEAVAGSLERSPFGPIWLRKFDPRRAGR